MVVVGFGLAELGFQQEGVADREFVAGITEGREPNASVAQVLPCYEVLHQIDRQLTG